MQALAAGDFGIGRYVKGNEHYLAKLAVNNGGANEQATINLKSTFTEYRSSAEES